MITYLIALPFPYQLHFLPILLTNTTKITPLNLFSLCPGQHLRQPLDTFFSEISGAIRSPKLNAFYFVS